MKSYRTTTKKNKTKKNKKHYKGANKSRRGGAEQWEVIRSNQYNPGKSKNGNTKLSYNHICPNCGHTESICTEYNEKVRIQCQCQNTDCLHIWFPYKKGR